MTFPSSISDYATPSPFSIGAGQTLGAAHRMMRDLKVRHLPVIDAAGFLVGIVSQRDLYLVETIPGVKQEEVAVEEVMNPRPYTVQRATPVNEAAEQMWQQKLGCAVVVEHGRVVGIFTGSDGLRALAEYSGPRAQARIPL